MNPLSRQPTLSRPWFREPWPWLLMSLPLTAVVAGLLTWWLAFRSDDGLVDKNYYKEGMAINRVLASQQRAKDLGISARLGQDGRKLSLSVSSLRSLQAEGRLRLRLLNPVRAGMDQEVFLVLQKDGYEGYLPQALSGRWNLKLEDEGGVWQLFAETSLPLQEVITLQAQ